jgi:DNA-directed RNA polymerase
MNKAANYLAATTLSSIGDVFLTSSNMMFWLSGVAWLTCTREGVPMSWTTPLGLPVMQPYYLEEEEVDDEDEHLNTKYGRINLQPRLEHDWRPDIEKQASAFPPNYIHSIDSTHMMMTTVECKNHDVEFAAVHDSYWTHPSTVDQMSQILREQFVELHEQPLLEILSMDLAQRYKGQILPPLPDWGDLPLSMVKDSKYFFN